MEIQEKRLSASEGIKMFDEIETKVDKDIMNAYDNRMLVLFLDEMEKVFERINKRVA